MQDFLDSYHDDGCCLEGPLYWNYGFGYFCYYADMVRDYTGGAHNWFILPKVRSIAEFRNKFYLQDQFVVPFADSSHELLMHIGLAHFLAREYDSIALPDDSFELLFDDDPRQRTMEFFRDIYWYDPDLKVNPLPENTAYDLKGAQWYIRKAGKQVFMAKGGHNDEPHNHNDIGSFALFDDNKFVFDDLGWPQYDKWYFTNARVNYICSGSHGHNLPIIGEKKQLLGKERTCTITEWTADTFGLDISSAYGLSDGTVHRKYTVKDSSLTIADTFTGCIGVELKERFVTRIQPEQGATTFTVAGWTLSADKPCTTVLSTEDFEPRLNCCKQLNMKPVETAILMDLVFVPDADEWTVTITIEK